MDCQEAQNHKQGYESQVALKQQRWVGATSLISSLISPRSPGVPSGSWLPGRFEMQYARSNIRIA